MNGYANKSGGLHIYTVLGANAKIYGNFLAKTNQPPNYAHKLFQRAAFTTLHMHCVVISDDNCLILH